MTNRGRHHTAEGLSPAALRATVATYHSLVTVGVVNLIAIAFWVIVLWRSIDPTRLLLMSVGEIILAFVFAFRGWAPWNFVLEQLSRGQAIKPEAYSPIQSATARFFNDKKSRLIQVCAISSGALVPWLIYGLSHAFGSVPFVPRKTPFSIAEVGLFAFVDTVRGRWIAFYALSGRFLSSWDNIQRDACPINAAIACTGDNSDPTGSSTTDLPEPARGISQARVVLWIVLLSLVMLLAGYLRGRARRHGL